MEGNPQEPSPLETAVRRLYALPLAEFVTARNDLAKQVKGGDREAWLRVKALPKASVTAWAVNQLFAREEEKMRLLLGLGERVRSLAAAEGEGLREALEEERAGLGVAETRLTAAREPGQDPLVQRVRQFQVEAIVMAREVFEGALGMELGAAPPTLWGSKWGEG